jgi:hypothetical protein
MGVDPAQDAGTGTDDEAIDAMISDLDSGAQEVPDHTARLR